MGNAVRAEAALVGVTLVWGTSFTLIKNALADSSTLLFLALRFSIAAALVAAIFRRELSGSSWRQAGGGVAAGLLLVIAYVLQTGGLRHTTASKSAFLTALCVVLTPLLGSLLYRQTPRRQEVLGVTLAMAGMALLTLPNGIASLSEGVNRGDLMTVGCAAAFALHILLIGRLTRSIGFETLSSLQLATVAVVSLATFWWVETPVLRPSTRLWTALGVTSVLCTALAYSVQAWAQQHTTATRAALIFSVEPVAAAATAWVAAGERLSGGGLAGAALILLGVLVVELKPRPGGGHP